MIEQQIEQSFVATLVGLKYEYRPDITGTEFALPDMVKNPPAAVLAPTPRGSGFRSPQGQRGTP